MKRSGFTLVEALFVVGVIVVIAAIAFPVFSSARESGRLAKCQSNLRQWGAAIHLYRQDWDGIEPAVGLKINSLYDLGLPPLRMRSEFVKTYHLDKPGVFYCPSARPVGKYRHQMPYRDQGAFAYSDPPQSDLDQFYRRGPQAGMLFCLYHNSNPLPEDNPTYATLRVVVLRFSQHVEVRNVKAWPANSADW
jgi:hypothetical protein